jgi:hypothetical protein
MRSLRIPSLTPVTRTLFSDILKATTREVRLIAGIKTQKPYEIIHAIAV